MHNTPESTLVILTPGFPIDESDSTCLPLQQELVLQLQKSYPEHTLHVLTFQYPYFKKNYNWNGIPVTSFDGRNRGGIARLLLRRQVDAELHSIHKKKRIAGILSFWYGECAVTGHRFGKKNNIRHVCWILGQDARSSNNYPERFQFPGNELVALSDFISDEFLRNHGIQPAHTVMPGINPASFASTTNHKTIDLIAAGSLIPLKQFDVFIEVVAALKNEMPGLQAMLVGEGPERTKLEQLSKRYGLEETISMPGTLPYPQLMQLMKQARLLLHTSSYEGFGCVCMEALAAGAIVISFHQPMKTNYENWHVVGTKEGMIQRAFELLNSTEFRDANAIINDIETTAKQFMDILSPVVKLQA